MVRDLFLPLLLACSVPLIAHSQDVRVVTRIVTDTTPAWNTWKGEGCSMNYPGAWHAGPAMGGDTVVVFSTVEAGHSPISVISLVIKDKLGKGASSKEIPKGTEIVGTEEPDASGGYSVEFSGNSGDKPMHGMQRMLVKAGKRYILTFISAPESYNDQLFLAEAMMNSFSFPKED